MNLQHSRNILYQLEAEIARQTNTAMKDPAKRALENAHLRCQDIAEFLLTAEKREQEK